MYKSDLSYQKVFPEPTERYRNVFNLPLLFSIDLPIFGGFFSECNEFDECVKKSISQNTKVSQY